MARRQRLTLAAIFGSALATINGSIVDVALPAVENDLAGVLSGRDDQDPDAYLWLSPRSS